MQLTGRASRLCTFLALAWAALLLIGAANSSADIEFCPFGSGTGQCKNTGGVAVDRASGHVYVTDSGNDRVNVFDENGTFLSSFGTSGSGSGQFDRPFRIAVDNDPASPAYRDLYVVDGNLRVQRFNPSGAFVLSFGAGVVESRVTPIAVGHGGTVYLGPENEFTEVRRIVSFKPDGTPLGSSTLPAGGSSIAALVADSGGDVYVSRNGIGPIEKYEATEPTATLLESFDGGADSRSLAIDSADHLFAAQRVNNFKVITEHDASGNVVKRFGYGEIPFDAVTGLAIGATGALFGTRQFFGETEGSNVVRIPQPAPGPLPCCLTATLGNTKATLVGGVNPEGKSTTYHFEYVTEDDYVLSGFANAALTPESGSVGSDFDLHIDPSVKGDPPPVSAQIGCTAPTVPPQDSCLEPKTKYRYRLVATNSDGEKNTSERTFETLSPFEITETWATDVGIGEAQIHASVNPLGIPASAQFEYVDDATFQASGFANAGKAPSSPITLGSSETEVRTATQLSSLAPDTLYHYRVAVSDPFAADTGPIHTFKTYPAPTAPKTDCPNQQFRTAASAPLPDCRAYEMVSPVDKNGNDIEVLVQGVGYPARLDQSSDEGDRFAYSSSTAFGDAQSAPWSSEYMATRTGGVGWSTHSLNPPRVLPSFTGQPVIKLDVQYKAFSSDLSEGWLFHDANPMLDECAPEGFINLYRRDNTTGEYEALVTNPPTNIEKEPDYRLELQGLSADGSHAVFRGSAKLTDDAAGAVGRYQLYMHIRDPEGGCGQLRLVSFLPNGKAAGTVEASVGSPKGPAEYRRSQVARGVSADGSRVFFVTTSVTSTENGPLYVRVNADQEQSVVSGGKCTEPDKGCTLQITTAKTQFWTAAGNGSRVIYSDDKGNELFEFDVDKALAGEPAKTLIAAKATGVAGASEDASRIYFVSREAIDGEGKAGEPNLYLYEPGQSGPERYRLVATLSERDLTGIDLFGLAVGVPVPISNGVRLSADGSHLAFVSQASLTGYDNLDASTGEPNIEVYLYDTASEAVHCISCNPSGARPRGRRVEEGSSFRRVSAMMAPGESQTFNPRTLSSDGNRLFFESFEALLPRDTNGKADVYEWMQASGAAECKEAGAELYVPSAAGCLSLISSGQSPVDTEFADASPDGSDVFIRTQSSLLPQDEGLVDVYDARMGGGLPQPTAPPAACEGEACQGPLSAPDDPTPASSAFEGAGNVNETVVKKKAKKQKKHAKKHKKKKSKARHNRRAGR